MFSWGDSPDLDEYLVILPTYIYYIRYGQETQPHKSDFGIEELVRMPEEQLNGTK